MTTRKEAGVLYSTACPGCEAELSLGWLPGGAEVPWVRHAGHRRPWPGMASDGTFPGPVTCGCGQVTLSLVAGGLRARVTWTGGPEPLLRGGVQYGSIRDRAVAE